MLMFIKTIFQEIYKPGYVNGMLISLFNLKNIFKIWKE
jgi:hypothetical protein